MSVYTTNAKSAYARALGFYSITAIPGAVISVLLGTYFLIYATDVLLIAPAVIGTMIAAGRIYDAFTDVAIATWSDRVAGRWGRRRPFIIAGGVLMIFHGALWLPPENFSETATLVWIGVMILVWQTASTLRTIPLRALGIELGQTPERRSWFITIMSLVGLPAMVGGHWLMQHFVDSPDARATGAPWFIGLGLVMAALNLTLGWFIKELPADQRTVERKPIAMMKEVLSVGYHRQLISVQFIESIAFGSLIFSIAYMLTYVLDRPDQMATIAVTYQLVYEFSKLGWLRMIPRWGMTRIWRVGFVLWLCMFVAVPFVLVGGFKLYLALAVAAGFAGGASVVNYAMLGDIADYDARQSGRQRQGIYMTIYELVTKIGHALTVFLLGWMLQLAGFVPNVEQGPAVIAAIIVASSLIPFIGVLFGLRILRHYRFYETEGISDGRREFLGHATLGKVVATAA